MEELKRRILYVEGWEDTMVAITMRLRMCGFNVETACTLAEGLHLAKSRKYDLFLLAGLLADAVGLELCMKIREFDRQTPIIFFSVLAYKADRDAALAAGAQAYLVKPNDLDRLEETIHRLLGQ
ncbi:MAG TPA: response regulator [Blastocatellia bacterium]|nr:response regulator [Blastocatellia bacterium]